MSLSIMVLAQLAVHPLEVEPLLGVAHLLQQPVLNVHGLVRHLEGLRLLPAVQLLQVGLGQLQKAGLLISLLMSLLLNVLLSHLQFLIRQREMIIRTLRLLPKELLLVDGQAEPVDLVHVVCQHLALAEEHLGAEQALVQAPLRHSVVLGGAVCEVAVLAVGDHLVPSRIRLIAVVAGEHAAVPPIGVCLLRWLLLVSRYLLP